MKKAQTVLDFSKDTVTIFGQEQPLLRIQTSSGHYAIPRPICPARLEIENSESKIRKDYRHCLTSVKTSSSQDKEKVVEKLHRQFCHDCSADKLKPLIKSSEIWKDNSSIIDLVDKIPQKCQICKMYKESPTQTSCWLNLDIKLTTLLHGSFYI